MCLPSLRAGSLGCLIMCVFLADPLLLWLWAYRVSPPSPEVARGVLTSLPGDSVILTCPGGEPEDNATVDWVLGKLAAGAHPGRWAGVGRRLLLRSVQLHDSGNYSCYRAGRPAGTVHLLVDVPPEEPQLSCFRKSPLSNVVCEWGPRSTPSPTTKAVLLVRKFDNSPAKDFQEPCQYSRESQKFSCQLAVPEGDSSFYVVSLCVANGVGSKLSKAQTFQGCGILAGTTGSRHHTWLKSRSPPAEKEVSTPTQAPTTNKDDNNTLPRDSANATSLPGKEWVRGGSCL
uniref:Interleukin 6 receptor n=1 Tax=Aotus nancymaae TaxID=37293 RepID=A0A2K5DER6_AOTNA